MRRVLLITLLCMIFLPESLVGQRVETDKTLNTLFSYQPPKKRFKFLKKKHLQNTMKLFSLSGLDTNAVYLTTDYIEDDKMHQYGYIRFFSEGVVFMSFSYKSKLSNDDLNDLSYGRWGAYKITETNNLIIEVYVNESMTHFHYYYGTIEGDRIKLSKVKMGKRWDGGVKSINFVWKKKLIEFRDSPIRWRICE